jgi:hypothetical protein
MKKERTALEWGIDNNSCTEALEWRKSLGNVTQKEAFEKCERGDWLIWQLQHLSDEQLKEILPQLLTALNVIVERAVKNRALNCGIKEVEQWAINWINGDKSVRSVDAAWAAADAADDAAADAARAAWAAADAADDAAADAARAAWSAANAAACAAAVGAHDAAWAAARSARAAAAAWSADAAWAAQSAARATQSAAWAAAASWSEELKLQAEDIRKEIPKWIWEV